MAYSFEISLAYTEIYTFLKNIDSFVCTFESHVHRLVCILEVLKTQVK